MKSETRSRAAAVAALTLALAGGLVAGCGGDSGGRPADAFIGRWFASDPVTTGFTLSCGDPAFSDIAPATGRPFRIFPALVFEHGELTDLAETSGDCALLNYDVSGTSATVPSPDPYFNEEAACGIPFTTTDAAGLLVDGVFLLLPDASWTFMVLPDKTPEGGDQGRLVGTARGHIIVFDTATTTVESNPDCTYGGMDTYFRLTQP